jgi:hypothetical protein
MPYSLRRKQQIRYVYGNYGFGLDLWLSGILVGVDVPLGWGMGSGWGIPDTLGLGLLVCLASPENIGEDWRRMKVPIKAKTKNLMKSSSHFILKGVCNSMTILPKAATNDKTTECSEGIGTCLFLPSGSPHS